MPSLTSYLENLLEQAKQIDRFLEEEGLPYPSYDSDALAALPPHLHLVRKSLANGSNELKKLTQGPAAHAVELSFAWTDLLTLRVINHYHIAEALLPNEEASYAEIATRVGLPESTVFRFLRNAMASNIFDEVPSKPGHVQHTAISRLLATDSGFRAMVCLQVDELGPASSAYLETLEKHGRDAREPNQTAFATYNKTELSTFPYLKQHPERAHRFGQAMQWHTQDEGYNLEYILQAYDWSYLDKDDTRIVDVGGGHGQVSTFLANKLTHPVFVVQDLPHVVETAAENLSKDLAERILFEVHNFMEPQAAGLGADAFVLRWILHDWPDDYAIQILRNLVPAMKPATKILILDDVLDKDPMKDLTNQPRMQLDIIMATIFNGKERTEAAFRQLIQAADSRFVVEGLCRPEGSAQTLIEITWRP